MVAGGLPVVASGGGGAYGEPLTDLHIANVLAITNLAGFKVYYGPSADNLGTIETINNYTVTTYLVGNLTPGAWFFAVTAFDSSGNESVKSGIASWTYSNKNSF